MPLHFRNINVENDELHGLVHAMPNHRMKMKISSHKTIWMIPKI